MKGWKIILLTIFCISCHHQPDSMVGDWVTHSKHYSGTYRIFEEGNKLSSLVLSYNDGTTKYQHDEKKTYYFFKGLKMDNGIYVDAVTGATTKNSAPKTLKINKLHIDTLEVTTYIRNKPLTEIWTRKK